MALLRETLLNDILSQPSAPFRERHVIARITRELAAAKVPHFIDPVGNIVIGAASQKEYLQRIREKSKEPLRLFIAHMDHPGFHGTRWVSPGRLEIQWHGGSPIEHLVGAKVWLADKNGWVTQGVLAEAKMHVSGRALEGGIVEAKASQTAEGLYGGFAFREPVWREGDVLYTKAADDLVGAFAITSLALDLFKKKSAKRPPFIGLLTRAEEVGFIGAIGHFELGWLKKAKRQILCVSLETSRTLPGADIGKGPVVRLGDRFTVFDARALRVFLDEAAKTLPDRHQKRVMDGGTCEGTTAMAYGLPTVGISVPLGNYHNQSFQGGPDSRGPNGPAPEFVHINDVQGLLDLCHLLLKPKLQWVSPWAEKLKSFKQDYKKYGALMRSGP